MSTRPLNISSTIQSPSSQWISIFLSKAWRLLSFFIKMFSCKASLGTSYVIVNCRNTTDDAQEKETKPELPSSRVVWLTHDATNDAADRAVVPDVLPLDLLRRGHPDRLHRRCLARRLEIRHLRWRRGAGLAGAGVGKRGGGSTRGLLGFGETAVAAGWVRAGELGGVGNAHAHAMERNETQLVCPRPPSISVTPEMLV